MKTARLVLKIVGLSLAVAASVCLVIAFWDKLTGLLSGKKAVCEIDDYDDALLYED